jgi:hypothetical protein
VARLLWLALNPRSGIAGLPTGWVHGKFMETTAIQCSGSVAEVTVILESFFWGCPDQFSAWLGSRFAERTTPFEQAAIQADLELLTEFGSKHLSKATNRQQLALL